MTPRLLTALRYAAPLPVLGLALMFTAAESAQPTPVETPLCQTYVSNANASLQATQARLQGVRGKAGGDLCGATRSHYLEVVKARAVMALCKSGADRAQDVGKLDATIAELDDVIASRCS